MKKLLFILLSGLVATCAIARNFTYKYEGQSIVYRVLDEDEKTCCVQSLNKVEGDLILPEHPMDDNIEFTLTALHINSFLNCTNLSSISIPSSVTSINRYAFSGCTNLTLVSIPSSITSIATTAFNNCSNLQSINIEEGNPNYSSEDGVWFNVDKTNLILYPAGKSGSYIIPNSVITINSNAFYECKGLTAVCIPNSVTTIGSNAFYDCESLSSVIVGNSVNEIGENAFAECYLTKAALPPTFSSSPFLCQYPVRYPAEGAIIEDGLVFGPDKSTIYFALHTLEGEYTIPNTVTSIGDWTFSYCTDLASVIIPNSVISIGLCAFSHCISMESIIIPNSVKSICDVAFFYCKNLTTLNIPGSVTSIGWSAFSACDNITSVTYDSKNPIECETGKNGEHDIFTNDVYQKAELIIPEGTLATFKATKPWNQFLNITEMGVSSIENIDYDASTEIDYTLPYNVYNLNGVHISDSIDNLSSGVYVVRQGCATKKISL